MREVLTRYITEDWGIFSKEDAKDAIPRFLLNDIVRYWRTMCVDFAYKRRKGQGKGWGLRTVKLRLSRKLIYVSGLLACYSCALDNKLNKRIKATRGVKKRQQIMINYLYSRMRLTPLDILASTVIQNKSLYQSAKLIIDSYDQFLAILSNKRKRNHLDKLKSENSSTDKVFMKAKEIGHAFQEGLDQMFLKDNGTPLFSLTKKYGVF